jgi:hypothetical protein
MATSFISTTIASLADSTHRTSSRAGSWACRWKRKSACKSRYDDIRLDLNNTVQRQFLSPIRSDAVQEGSVGLFVQNTLHWTEWLRCRPLQGHVGGAFGAA